MKFPNLEKVSTVGDGSSFLRLVTHREFSFILLAFLGAAASLVYSAARGAVGFPLDDAWIHQVYARNIGTRGEFAFFAGQPSVGSTSPLWTILLSAGYLLHVDFRAWTYLLGALFIGLSAMFCARLLWRLSGQQRLAVYCSLFTLFEWHLAWSAVSGMEIPLFVFLSLLLVERFFARERVWVQGLISGLLTLTRPEGVVLGALVGLGVLLPRRREERQEKSPKNLSSLRIFAVRSLTYVFGWGFLLLPYLAFNVATSGAIFPNTFYAKNAEYASLIEHTPFLFRFAQTFAAPWVGAQILLLPGFIFIGARLVRDRNWGALLPIAWIAALPALYALRLPVIYQHGRYEMPVVPFIALHGIWGTIELFALLKNFVVRATWGISVAAVLIAFWFFGLDAYASDVTFVDCEMVQTARWVAQNAASDQLVAAHDIGALGYFYSRPFIDLAGLASPEVIPIIRDESRLREFLLSRRAAFVIVFPDWYNSLTHDFLPIFQTNCAATLAAGGTNLTVYEIK